jgi:tRNA pseudouridine38-40 synthase
VAHFDSKIARPTADVERALNAVLSRDVAVRDLSAVPAHFHARYTATSRRYCYLLLTAPTRRPLERWRSWHVGRIDDTPMAAAADVMIGTHDFAQMGRALSPKGSTVRHVSALEIIRSGELVRLEVEANAFLRHQVRRMVGLLVAVGRGAVPVGLVSAAMKELAPLPPYRRAPAQGLCLEQVTYPADPSQWRTKREAEDDYADYE